MTELLRAHSRVRSADIEEIHDVMVKVLGPHRLDPYPHRTRGVSVFNAVSLGEIALCYSEHGVPVRVRHEPLDPFLLVRFSLSGSVTLRSGRSEMQFDPRVAAVLDPSLDCDMSKDTGAQALVLRVDRGALQAELHRILGRPLARRLRFNPSLDMKTPQARSWYSILRTLCADLDGPQGVNHPMLLKPVQRLVIAQLLTTTHHSATDELAGIGSTTPETLGPRTIRRADQLISDHCREPLSVSDIAEAVGVSVRSLQNGFRRHLDTTPSERLRQARLAGVRAELLASQPADVTVSKVASEWGFRHIGRFARSYRLAFGETPSQTLRR